MMFLYWSRHLHIRRPQPCKVSKKTSRVLKIPVISRDALDLGALPGIFQEVNRHCRVEHRVGEDEDRQLPVLGEEIGGKREDADEQGGHKDPRHPIVPALPELFRRAVDFQFMNIFLPLEGENHRVEDQLHHIECEEAVAYSPPYLIMFYEYEMDYDEQRDRQTAPKNDVPPDKAGIEQRQGRDREQQRLGGTDHQIAYREEFLRRSRQPSEQQSRCHHCHDEKSHPEGVPRADVSFRAVEFPVHLPEEPAHA